ncbi:DinB family protein [Pseudactinotalea terrae]|uniref:DinB family protein n=1 Tax=Pseudactinotalea terrae TaxID=1743262 RepID=UPI0012E1C0F4|nr:DinB family protein [Pseudactinotalea terrae]
MTINEESRELEDLIEALARHRGFLRQTLAGVTDQQAGERSTVSALCLGGLVKHVAATEKSWMEFAVHGEQHPEDPVDWGAIDWSDPSPDVLAFVAAREAEFAMGPGETVAGVLAMYEQVAAETEQTLRSLDLNTSHPLPAAPWFEPGAEWTVRRTMIHIVAETAQHAGHADIIREAIDGAKTMG